MCWTGFQWDFARKMETQALTIGVDVGGTNTDAVIIKQAEVLCSAKTPTTEDVTSGLDTAIREAISTLPAPYSSNNIQRVNIGTTHFVNAVVQRRDVVCVAVLRLCGPASWSVPPFSDFPEDLRRVVAGPYYFLSGGYEYNGTIISEVDEDEVRTVISEIENTDIKNVVITGVFSPVNTDQEDQVKDIIHQINPSISVTVSHDVGLIGFLERENASILNESLKPLCLRTVNAFRRALRGIGLMCPFYLTQNDGTIISAERAIKFPVLTFASGPTNSMRGAAHLSNVQDAIVVDIGGTTTDVGVLCKGFPRQSSTRVKVGGVNTNFRMPDVLTIGLGGGSHVCPTPHTERVKVGPQSVGYRLIREAMVFGGEVITATDIAVAASLVDIGNRHNVSAIPEPVRTGALATIKKMVEDAIDQVKISGDDQPVILVGGGTVIIDQNWKLEGVSRFVVPSYFQAANAVGAALSKVSGIRDRIFSLEGTTEQKVMDIAEAEAHQNAVENGAQPGTIETVEKMAVSLAYLPGNVTRIQVKVIGDLAENLDQQHVGDLLTAGVEGEEAVPQPHPQPPSSSTSDKASADLSDKLLPENEPSAESQCSIPHIDPSTGDWLVNEFDVECIAIGAGILGCGGGGSPYIEKLRIQQLLKAGKEIRVIHPDRLENNSNVVMVAFMGAPVILVEKIQNGLETSAAVKALHPFFTAPGESSKNSDKPFSAVVCGEVGGLNSLEPFAVAAEHGIPVVDADGMGRAYPELQMFLPFVYGCQPYPASIADEKGNVLVMSTVTTSRQLEKYFRMICVQMGCSAAISVAYAAKQMKDTHVQYTLSRVWRLGNAVLQARRNRVSPIDTILEHEGGKLLFTGKISKVERNTVEGFTKGIIIIESTTQDNQQPMIVEFQNENYLAYYYNDDGTKNIQACVPDLISLVDSETGKPITTEEVRYGLRVALLAMCCSPLWTTPEALEVGGPKAFKYSDVEYIPVGKYVEHPPIPHPGPL